MKISKLAFSVLMAASLMSCGSGGTQTSEATEAPAPESQAATFSGIFTGTTPCADCPGIYTVVEFSPNGDFYEHMKYLERDATNESKGHWEQADSLITVTFDGGDAAATPTYYKIVDESSVQMLDQEKNPITSALAPLYVLQKKDTVLQK